MQCDKQAVHMKNWQGVNQHIAPSLGAAPAPTGFKYLGIAEQIAMGQHGALAAAGGTTGVEDGRELVGGAQHHCLLVSTVAGTLQQRAGAIIIEREHMSNTGLESNFAHPTEVFAGTDHHCRFGIANKVRHLSALVGGVQRQKYQAGTQRSKVEQHRLDRLVNLGRKPSAGRQLQRDQQIGQHGAGPFKVAPAVVQTGVGLDSHTIKVRRKTVAQGAEKISLRGAARYLGGGWHSQCVLGLKRPGY